jgi:hypothetical protein
MNIELGKKYRDRVTGFEGIATSRHEYLNGCVRISLTSTALKDGKTIEPESFDIQQLEFVNGGISVAQRETGGPGHIPSGRHEPRS